MASKAFTCCASTLFSNTRASSPLLVGLGPCLDLSPGSSKTLPSSKHSLVVRAQLQGGGRVIDPLGQKGSAYTPKNVALLDETSPYGRYSSSSTNLPSYIVRTPWNTSEDESEIKMWFDMPELKPENIQVNVVDDLLVINGDDGNDNNGQGSNIVRPYDSIIELPSNCWKEQITAVFKNGVLYIKVPKITKLEQRVINIPVKNV